MKNRIKVNIFATTKNKSQLNSPLAPVPVLSSQHGEKVTDLALHDFFIFIGPTQVSKCENTKSNFV